MIEFTAVHLFFGVWGLDIGFERAGFRTIWANDFDKDACKTHQNWNRAKVVCDHIGKVDISQIPDSDIILGDFQCQEVRWAVHERLMIGEMCFISIMFGLLQRSRRVVFFHHIIMLDKFIFQSKEYQCRKINTEYGEFLISSDELEFKIIDDRGKYISEEAKLIDEMIFFYVPTDILFSSETVINDYIEKYV